jgi:uncharacterized membrane protein required for colicin V production
MSLSWIDVVVVCVLLRTMCMGWLRGVRIAVMRLAVVVGALVAAGYATVPVTESVSAMTPMREADAQAMIFFVGVGLAYVVVWLMSRVLVRFVTHGPIALWDRMGGVGSGAVAGWLLAGILCWLMVALPFSRLRQEVYHISWSGHYAVRTVRAITRWTTERLPGAAVPLAMFETQQE